jgi:phosphotransferase system IIB component
MRMGPVANFILALVVATVTIAGGSLAWPRITTQPRPKLLQDVKNIVIKTSVGKETANVLGVSDEAHVAPINLGKVAAGAAGQVKTMIQNRVQAIIVGNAVNQLHQQFERLSPDQKKQIQQSICNPLEKK